MRLQLLRNLLFLAVFSNMLLSMTEGAQAQTLDSAVPSPPVAASEGTYTVTVRAGVHPGFDRLVFDWPHNVAYRMQHNGSEVVLTFSMPGTVHLENGMLSHLTRARGLSASTDANGHLVMHFAVNPKANLKDFTSDKSIVVDIEGEAAPDIKAMVQKDTFEKSVSAKEVPEKPVSTNTAAPTSILPAATPPEVALVPQPKEAPVVATPPLVQIALPQIKSAAHSTAITQSGATGKKGELAFPDMTDTPLLVASLDPHVPTRTAIFQRAGYVYIIFDRKLTFTVEAMTAGQQEPRVKLEPVDLPKFSGYRFAVPLNLDVHSTLNGTVWQIFISRQVPDVPVSANLVAQPDFALGARFLLPLPDAPEPVHFKDPVVGDDLILIPLAQTEAFSIGRRMADFRILPAAQGLVIKPFIETMTVRNVSDGIEISAEGGLHLSSAQDTGAFQEKAQKTRATAAGKSVFDIVTWSGKPNETFTQTRQRLQQIIVDVPEAERNRARLELGRFYFAHGYGEEASAVFAWIAKDTPDLLSHADFLALTGASKILSYRAEEGLKDLSAPGLEGQPEIELWQGVGYAELRDWTNAEEKFSTSENQLDGYPEPFYSRFSVLAIEAALAVGKDQEAAGWLDHFINSQHAEDSEAAIAYLQGVLQAKGGHAAVAEEDWKKAAAMPDRLYKVRAEMALIDLGVSTGSLTPAQAADRFETLRFAWRGDDLELDILQRLGNFYIQAKNIKAGLGVLAQAVQLYPNSAMTPRIRAEMQVIFHDVFLGDLGKSLSPLDALTLYQQYRDLMPTGKDGDVVISNLAERLVAIDLLDQAGLLLEDLVKNRLQGLDKARASSRLAAIRLLDHKPDEALTALTYSDGEALPKNVQNERFLLRAKALSEQHHDDEALALLQDINTTPAKLLRADIAMHGQHWQEATKALLDLVGPPPDAGTVLSSSQAEWLLNCAMAYALANDQVGLDKLAIDYGAAMAGTPQNDSFRILTEPQKTTQLRDVAAAQAKLGEVDMFQDFLNTYRKATGDTVANPSP